jgi:hypothetical protein
MAEVTGDDGAQADVASAMVPDLRKIIPNALIAGVLPIVAYAILRRHVDSDGVALATVMVIPITHITIQRILHGRFEPVGVIALVGISIGLVGAVALHGNPLLLKLRESTVTSIFAAVNLVSLRWERPLMYSLARAFATDGDDEKAAMFEEIWQRPGVPARFRLITLIWGLALLGEAAVRTTLALTLGTQAFLAVSQVVNWLTLGCLIAYTMRYLKASTAEYLAGAGPLGDLGDLGGGGPAIEPA